MMKLTRIMRCVMMGMASLFMTSPVLSADIAVLGGPPSDPFWSIMKKGMDDARYVVEANGGSVNYMQIQNYENAGADWANLTRTAVNQAVDGIVVPNALPEAQDEAVKMAVDAGIKVIFIATPPREDMDSLGVLNILGSDEYIAGVAAGEYFSKKSYKNVICVNTQPGAIALESRCRGIADGMETGGGKSTQLPLPATSFGDFSAIAEAIKATLLRDETIDGVITISSGDGDAAAVSIRQAGREGRVALATFDFNSAGLARIAKGEQLFSVDQQPYLQTFLAVTLLAAHIDFGTDLPVKPLLTGPNIIDASNVDAAVEGTAKGAR